MTQQELKNYILILNDMEHSIYMMTRMCEKIDEEKDNLRKKEYSYPESPKKAPVKKFNVFRCIFFENPIALAPLLLCGWALGTGGLLMILTVLGLALYVVLLPINIIAGIIYYRCKKPKVEKERKNAEEKYLNECRQHKNACDEIDLSRKNDRERMIALDEQKSSLLKRKAEAESKLKEFYEKININEKFRGILPMSYMAEFIKLGIATKLEGADGLYYLVLRELKDTEFKYSITAKLDEAVQKEQTLYKEIERMKRTCDVMFLNTVNNASTHTIDDYQSERIAKELEYQTYLMKKGIYG